MDWILLMKGGMTEGRAKTESGSRESDITGARII
jgi:hypothetical protein